jgi:hypothetical protein
LKPPGPLLRHQLSRTLEVHSAALADQGSQERVFLHGGRLIRLEARQLVGRRLEQEHASSASGNMRMGLYEDSGGLLGPLIATTEEKAFSSTSSGHWEELAFASPPAMVGGASYGSHATPAPPSAAGVQTAPPRMMAAGSSLSRMPAVRQIPSARRSLPR